jgi:formiminoglutamate deiminase
VTKATYWSEHAWLGTTVEPGVLLETSEGRITAVRTGTDSPPPGAEILRGLTLPGLANAHSHAFHRALRGTVQVGSGTFWTWREVMYSVADRLTPDTYHALARAVYAEMALAGITAVGEFHYVHHAPGGTPYADPNAMGEALLAAAAEAGIRITLLDTAYLSSGFGQPPTAHQLRFSDGARQHRNTLSRFSARVWRHRASDIFHTGSSTGGQWPALATSTSSRPSAFTASGRSASTSASDVRSARNATPPTSAARARACVSFER